MRFIQRIVPTVIDRSQRADQLPSSAEPIDAKISDVVATAAEHSRHGRLGQALALVDRALIARPDDYQLLFARASLLFSWWRYAEAYAVLTELAQSGSRDAAFYAKLGWTCHWLGRVEEASTWMRKAVELSPEDWSVLFGRAIALHERKRPAAARQVFERALALKPDDVHSISNLVACNIELGHAERAEQYARISVERNPGSSSAMIDLGIALCERASYTEAVAAFRAADSMGFAEADARDESVNYSICLLRAGQVRDAVCMMEDKLRRHPSSALHSHFALALLTLGRFREGWDQYEFRWTQEPLLSWRAPCAKPVWAGQDLHGKAILLRAEQGYGDFMQFIRYALHVKALGATVLLEVREELRELAESAPGVDRVLRADEPYPDFDYHIYLLSIPRVLDTSLQSIPDEVPYLHADPKHEVQWKDLVRRNGSLNVGLVWAGSSTHIGDRFRSMSLRALAPLRKVPGVRFYSLQKGPAAHELIIDRGYDPIVDLGPKLTTFADTAAAIEQLDLVISVDTSVVHLAGALGKAVWTLVAVPGDWRWLEDREDSPWYPTMRLFRQRQAGEGWDAVIARVAAALKAEVERRGAFHAGRNAGRETVSSRVTPTSSKHTPMDARPDICRVAESRSGMMTYTPRDPVTAKALEFYGECRQLQVELLSSALRPGMTVLEVGAGIGVHSVTLASAVGPTGHIFLYEDDNYLKQILHENLLAHRVSNATVMRRSLTRLAATDSKGPGVAHPIWGIPELEAAGQRTETIDDLGLERLDLLKIDREDSDALHIIEGARGTLHRLRPRLFVAVSCREALHEIKARLDGLAYACWRAETPMFNPANHNGQDVDLFDGRTSAALLAIPEETALEIDGCERLS